MKILLSIRAFVGTVFNELKNLRMWWLLFRNGLSPWSPEIRKIRKENEKFLINMLVFNPPKNKRPHAKLY